MISWYQLAVEIKQGAQLVNPEFSLIWGKLVQTSPFFYFYWEEKVTTQPFSYPESLSSIMVKYRSLQNSIEKGKVGQIQKG